MRRNTPIGKYGCTTFGQACAYEKEEIRHALNGEILLGWDEEGRHWGKGTKEETDRVILAAYDSLFYQAEQLRISGKALEKVYGRITPEDFKRYIAAVAEEERKPSVYVYEKFDDEN